jgi:hypothetical protein
MNLYARVISIGLFFILSACSSMEAATPVGETVPPEEGPSTQTPVSSELKFYPLKTETGNETVDVVLSALANGGNQELAKLFSYTKTACMTVNALGGPPPCLDGEKEGTVVEVLPSLGVEGSYLRKADAGKFTGLNVMGLYAVYEVPDSAYSEENFPAGDYGIALVGEKGTPDIVLQVRKEGIVRIDYIFDGSGSRLADVLDRDAVKFVLPPLSP